MYPFVDANKRSRGKSPTPLIRWPMLYNGMQYEVALRNSKTILIVDSLKVVAQIDCYNPGVRM